MSPRGPALPARLVLATGNAGKLREMRAILAPWSVEVLPQSDFTAAEDDGRTAVQCKHWRSRNVGIRAARD